MAASPPAFSYQPSALSKSTTRLANSMGLDPAHRTQHRYFFATFALFAVIAFAFAAKDTRVQKKSALRTPAGFSQALIKIYNAL